MTCRRQCLWARIPNATRTPTPPGRRPRPLRQGTRSQNSTRSFWDYSLPTGTCSVPCQWYLVRGLLSDLASKCTTGALLPKYHLAIVESTLIAGFGTKFGQCTYPCLQLLRPGGCILGDLTSWRWRWAPETRTPQMHNDSGTRPDQNKHGNFFVGSRTYSIGSNKLKTGRKRIVSTSATL